MKIRALLTTLAIVAASIVAAPANAAATNIGIAYDIGGRGDRSYNDAAAVGIEKAQKQFTFTVEPVVTDGTSADRDRRVRSLIAKNCNPIIAVGAGYAATIQGLAVEFPEIHFAILNDASIDALNVTSLIFADTHDRVRPDQFFLFTIDILQPIYIHHGNPILYIMFTMCRDLNDLANVFHANYQFLSRIRIHVLKSIKNALGNF